MATLPIDHNTNRNTAEAKALFEEIMSYEQDALQDTLVEFVLRSAAEARTFRQTCGVDAEMDRAVNAVNQCYNPDEAELLDQNAVYMGITALKVRAFRSWVGDILMNAEDKPWTIKPTPQPDLPEEVEDFVIDQLLQEMAEGGVTGVTGNTVVERLSTLKRMAQTHIDQVTSEAAEKMENTIYDQLLEGGWRTQFDKFLDDLGVMPAAVLKAPVVRKRPKLVWHKSEIKVVEVPFYELRRVSPRDFYPSPDSTSPQDGTFVVEKMRLSAKALHDYEKINGFNEEAIRYVTSSNTSGWAWEVEVTPEEPVPPQISAILGIPTGGVSQGGAGAGADPTELGDTDKLDATALYDVVVYYGAVKGDLLAEYGIKDVTPSNTYEAEVWVCADKVLRAILNPHPLKLRPFYATSFDKKPDSFWGRGLPALLNDVQRVANAAARALVKNMAFTAGPIGEFDSSRLSQEEDITEMTPYRLYAVDADPILNNTLPAFRFHNVPSAVEQLNIIYERFTRQADNVSGVPAYVLGDPAVAGAGRTLGGLSLLMGNAAKGIKRVIASVDKDVIEPVIEAYVIMNLMYSDDPSIKFDTSVVARGSSGLLQREISQARAVEVLQMLTPYVQAGLAPKEGIDVVLRDVIRGLGYSPDEVVPDRNRNKALASLLKIGQTATQQEAAPPVAALDGRSAPAIQVEQQTQPFPAG
jgi:hypothetical protein